MTLEEALENYYDCCLAEMEGYTVDKKKKYLAHFLNWLDKPLGELTINDVYRFFNDVCPGKTNEVQFRIKTNLKCFLRFLSETTEIKLPFTLIKVGKSTHKPTYAVTFDEFNQLSRWCLEKSKDNRTYIRWHAVINMLFYLGVRRTELREIELNNIDLKNQTILIKCKKTGAYKIRKYFFDLQPYLEEYKPKKYLFPICGNAIAEIVRLASKQCGMKPIHPHCFRAGLITFLSYKGWPIQDIAEYVGQTVEITQGYITHNPAILLERVKDTFKKRTVLKVKAGRASVEFRIDNK